MKSHDGAPLTAKAIEELKGIVTDWSAKTDAVWTEQQKKKATVQVENTVEIAQPTLVTDPAPPTTGGQLLGDDAETNATTIMGKSGRAYA
jgi:hypothetical protein